MDKLKQNPFWVAMGAAGLVLLILFGVLCYPSWEETGALEAKIAGTGGLIGEIKILIPPSGIPSSADIKAWNDLRDELDGHRKEILGVYRKYDSSFKRWFDGGKPPNYGGFMARHDDHKVRLEEKVKGKVQVGLGEESSTDPRKGGWNWDDPGDLWNRIKLDQHDSLMMELQKRYWIRERIANICLELQIPCIRDVRFVKPLHPELKSTGGGGASIKYPVVDPAPTAGGIFKELALPGTPSLGETLTFGVTVELPYSKIPRFVEKLLSPETEPKILMNVIGLRTNIVEQNDVSVSSPLKVPFGTPQAEIDARRRKMEDDHYQKIQPQFFELSVTAQVIDFAPESRP